MATIDSGTDTLFSDDSPCDDLAGSGDETEIQIENESVSNRLAPPNIQPYSGILEKGKVVIRPIAFKPSLMSPGARFGLAGERYGSTPILTRPSSRLNGSTNDIHKKTLNCNYSLDRKLRSCPSTSCSPPLAMTSLTSLPNKLMNYDSLESVRKSPLSAADSSLIITANSSTSLLDLTPSPSDSGISELEAALRDRDSELAYLRQTMEHNEQVIFRVYQEKENVWEREIRRLKSIHENRLRAAAQKSLKLEQILIMQTYQLQQDKKRFCDEAQKTNCQNDRLKEEIALLQSRLEETEWGLCQKTGEIALLKTQLKDYQSEQTSKCQEILQLRNEYRELREELNQRDLELSNLKQSFMKKDEQILRLQDELFMYKTQTNYGNSNENIYEMKQLQNEICELRQELSDMSLNEYGGVEPGRMQKYQSTEIPQTSSDETLLNHECPKENSKFCYNLIQKLQQELQIKTKHFENERYIWAQEKEKVLRYQRQLQINYVQMYRRTCALESEIESLTVELELDKTGMKKKLSAIDLTNQTIEL